ncbi:O-methyltransferase involved in polyketide biosynthesis [Tenggerimyces flavus]|nr:O-methyltransferase involved in polyketide biosynthesis [Tenggerimyces flavus]
MRGLPQLSAEVHYVTMDFTTDSLLESLPAAGAALDRVTLFLWEGVTPYLTEPAVNETLNAIREFAPGSSVVHARRPVS